MGGFYYREVFFVKELIEEREHFRRVPDADGQGVQVAITQKGIVTRLMNDSYSECDRHLL